MAHLFVDPESLEHTSLENERTRPDPRVGDWPVVELDEADAIALSELCEESGPPVRRIPASADCGGGASRTVRPVQLRRCSGRGQGGDVWALVCRRGREPQIRVNGLRLRIGLRVLRHRDEIAVGSVRYFFSTERLARAEPFPGAAAADASRSPIHCARCKQTIEAGQTAVRCPRCSVWHHQSSELPCWDYAETCACGCGQRTESRSTYTWTPEGL